MLLRRKWNPLPKEEWRPVVGIPEEFCRGYQVSDLGRVKGRRGTVLTPKLDRYGYPSVTLYGSKVTHKLYRGIHRLVLLAFVGEDKERPCAMHKNNIRGDNRRSNLQWGTHKDNTQQCIRDGRFNRRKGSANNLTKLTEQVVREI